MTPKEEVEEVIAIKRQETELVRRRTTKHSHTHTEIKVNTAAITSPKESL
jgi:hypothetical protein